MGTEPLRTARQDAVGATYDKSDGNSIRVRAVMEQSLRCQPEQVKARAGQENEPMVATARDKRTRTD